MPALGKWLNVLDERVEDPQFAGEFLMSVFPEWEVHCGELLQLATGFPEEMSPRIYCDCEPLCRCDADTRAWLGALMHKLWLSRYPVQLWMEAAVDSVHAAQETYHRLQSALATIGPDCDLMELRPLRDQFREFRLRCQEVGTKFGEFPCEVPTT
jgi:hypothetical protein